MRRDIAGGRWCWSNKWRICVGTEVAVVFPRRNLIRQRVWRCGRDRSCGGVMQGQWKMD